ncbi:MAG: GNAT family N-acetyltransferase [Candidatus Eisenbacteria bacterium]
MRLEFSPLTREKWVDFEELFGTRGAAGGCWCMWWRLEKRDFDAKKGDGNRRAMKALVRAGHVPGLLAYSGGRAVGWCAVAPREEFPRLAKSRILSPVDDRDVWSVVCLFVDRSYRCKGVSTRLLKAAVRHVADRGGKIVEGYPVEPRQGRMPDLFAYHGLSSAFKAAGFREASRRSETRSIVRRFIRYSEEPLMSSDGSVNILEAGYRRAVTIWGCLAVSAAALIYVRPKKAELKELAARV